MDRWRNSVAVVTGASSGIGAAIVKDLLNVGLVVVALDIRQERIDEYRSHLPVEQRPRLHVRKCDVSSLSSVNETFDWIIAEFNGVDILINSAGIYAMGQLCDMDVSKVQRTLQVNVMGVVYCTQRAFKSMKDRSFDGHIVIVNSMLGHMIPRSMQTPPIINMYAPSKYAITAITEVYRQEFMCLDTKVKITSVSPGLTDTEIVPDDKKTNRKMLKAEDISQCVLFTLSTPAHMQVHEIMVQPTTA